MMSESNRELDGETIASRLQQHRSAIARSLPVDLSNLLCAGIEVGLFEMKDLEIYNRESTVRNERNRELVTAVLKKQADGCSKFLQCIQKSLNDDMHMHMGLVYIEVLLKGEPYAKEKDIEESAILESQIQSSITQFMDINLEELCPILYGKHLITDGELNTLSDTNTRLTKKQRNLRLFEILDTKGPTAYKLFKECLGEEHSHLRHKELFDLCSRLVQARDRKRKADEVCTSTPSKRLPKRVDMQGGFKRKRYAQIVRSWRGWVSNGQWSETEKAERKCMLQLQLDDTHVQKEPLAVTLAGLLQGAIARIMRKHYPKAAELLEKCDSLCSKVSGNNQIFLRGRCMYTWSWLYRYLKETKKAKDCAGDAMQILFNVEPGEDTALANYGYATTIIEYHVMSDSPSDQMELDSAKSCLEFAIDQATIEDRGLDHIAPHSHLRLAQMHLRSTHYEPGKNTDTESIRKASDCLKAIDLDSGSVPPRSKCIFLLTESDLYRCRGDIATAQESARHALMIAEGNGFETEITSANIKLESIK